MVSVEEVPMEDNYFSYSPLLQKEYETREMGKSCFSL